jgi:1-deoxy-D-xylulose-5-phosphate synthase
MNQPTGHPFDFSLLAQVNFPAELRLLPESELIAFCDQLRNYLISHCSVYGGHFAGSLGVVELTTALHYVLDTPNDLLVWDVGHQAYGHKLITGRRSQFHTNRLLNGISGFPKRAESEYDTFGVGHSSTSISAALGMALALRAQNDPRQVVAVIGDGAMTGGMAFEALNHAGHENANLLVILNDNNMSIDNNVGALNTYLTDITSSRTFNRLRSDLWNFMGKLSSIGEAARHYAAKLEDGFMATFFKPGLLFESLGFRYFGPIDGHDVNHLVRILRDLQDIPGPKLLHCVTVKGKGFAPAEADQIKWHAPSFNFDVLTGAPLQSASTITIPKPTPPKYQDVFGSTAIELASMDERIMAVSPAMLSGSGLTEMKKLMPDRCFDVGICEQHAVTLSAGMATQGLIPICNIYSTFLQRGYDQVVHDVAIQDLKVIFCLDRGGLVGADGATHHGCFDMAYLRALPNMIVSSPMDEPELRNLLYTAVSDDNTHPFSIRYPRGNGVTLEWKTPMNAIEVGTGRCVNEGEDVAILTIGPIGHYAQQAIQTLNQQGIYPSHYDMRFVKPLDHELLRTIAQRFSLIITVEDGCLMGGFGSAVLEWMADNHFSPRVKRLGIPDAVIHQGTQDQLYALCGYDKAAIVAAVQGMLESVVARV